MNRKPIGHIVVWVCDGMEFVQGLNDSPGAPPNCLTGNGDHPILFPTRADAQRAIRRTKHYDRAIWEDRVTDADFMRIVPVFAMQEWNHA
jgi:hypothetical protein